MDITNFLTFVQEKTAGEINDTGRLGPSIWVLGDRLIQIPLSPLTTAQIDSLLALLKDRTLHFAMVCQSGLSVLITWHVSTRPNPRSFRMAAVVS